jgi:hypothetical protein
LDNYQHDYSERNFLFLPAVMTTSGRISGDFLRLLYILAHRQAANFFTRMGIPDPSSKAYKQRRGTYFYYNRAAIGLACAQATAMRIDIAPHKWQPLSRVAKTIPENIDIDDIYQYVIVDFKIDDYYKSTSKSEVITLITKIAGDPECLEEVRANQI